jgi:hypothetical protein
MAELIRDYDKDIKKNLRRKPTNTRNGSFPFDKIQIRELVAQDKMHPEYWPYGPEMRTLLFAQEYWKQLMKRKCLAPDAILDRYVEPATELLTLLADGDYSHFQRGRIMSDIHTAKYDDYLESIFELYINMGLKQITFPTPNKLYGPKAIQSYKKYLNTELKYIDLYKRLDKQSHLLPENYEGTSTQIRFNRLVLDDCIRKYGNRKRSELENQITRMIEKDIMSKEYADSMLNTAVPCYNYTVACGKQQKKAEEPPKTRSDLPTPLGQPKNELIMADPPVKPPQEDSTEISKSLLIEFSKADSIGMQKALENIVEPEPDITEMLLDEINAAIKRRKPRSPDQQDMEDAATSKQFQTSDADSGKDPAETEPLQESVSPRAPRGLEALEKLLAESFGK